MSDVEANIIDRIIDVARGAEPAGEFDRENREARRRPYHACIALVQLAPDGRKHKPLTVQCKDISVGGLGVISPHMLRVGQEAAIMILRSNGQAVLAGGRVVHCSCVAEMRHEAGVEFIDLPQGISFDDFRDELGRMPRLARHLAA